MRFEIPSLADWLFLDLETTGLAGGTGTYAFMVGLGRLTPKGFHLRQYFLRDLAAERALLTQLASELEAVPLLVSYNGKVFDAPLLQTRYRLARAGWPCEERPHLDLLYPARRLWKPRCGSARLMDLEREILGHQREEDVPGELIPRLYFDFLRRGDERPLEVVFQHNADDLLTLAALAARLLSLVATPEEEYEHSLELAGVARLLELEEPKRATKLYEQALTDHLPLESARMAQLRLSFLYKRGRDYESAAALWRELSEGQPADRIAFIALEQLAICYEHRLGQLLAATEATRNGLTRSVPATGAAGLNAYWGKRFAHRLQRLMRKLPELGADRNVCATEPYPLTARLCGSRFPAEGL